MLPWIHFQLEGDDEDEYAHEMAIRRLRTQALVLNIAQEVSRPETWKPVLGSLAPAVTVVLLFHVAHSAILTYL